MAAVGMGIVLWRLELKRCSGCGEFKPRSEFYRHRRGRDGLHCECRSCACRRSRDWLVKLNLEMIHAYGNKCRGCGESDPNALTLDHIFNDGAQERRELRASPTSRSGSTNIRIMRKLKKLGWPQDRYQLLCASCQLRKVRHAPLPNDWDGSFHGLNLKQILSNALDITNTIRYILTLN